MGHRGSMTDYFYFLFKILLAAAASRGGMRDYFLFSIKNFAGGGGLQTFFSLGASRKKPKIFFALRAKRKKFWIRRQGYLALSRKQCVGQQLFFIGASLCSPSTGC